MPLIRKTGNATPEAPAGTADVLKALTGGTADERWNAARAAANVAGGVDALAAALPAEADPRVREAMFTSLTRAGTAASVDAIVPLLRNDEASLRTGALDALRAMPNAVRARLPELLRDSDSDVRLLSCEIARSLPGAEATAILCTLLEYETEGNVCAAAIEVLAEVGTPSALPALERCAQRFSGMPFLGFAVGIARDRILAQAAGQHG